MGQSTLFRSCRARTLFQGGLIHMLLNISAETDNCRSFYILLTIELTLGVWPFENRKYFSGFCNISFLSFFLSALYLENYLRYFLETLLVYSQSWHLLDVSAVLGHGEMSAALLFDI